MKDYTEDHIFNENGSICVEVLEKHEEFLQLAVGKNASSADRLNRILNFYMECLIYDEREPNIEDIKSFMANSNPTKSMRR